MEDAASAKNHLLKTSRLVVALAVLLNRVFTAAVSVALPLSAFFSARFEGMLLQDAPSVDARSEAIGLRLMMVIGIVMGLGIEVLLSALRRTLASASTGSPFIAANAQRLRTMGWALLCLQLLDIPAALIGRLFSSLGTAASDIGFAPGGWLAVLMLFVLSRVFTAGTAMQDDLEGTV